MFKELDCLKILVSAVNIRNPLSIFFTIVQIQHGSNRVHTESVHMIILYPHECTSDQEVLDLILAVILSFEPSD